MATKNGFLPYLISLWPTAKWVGTSFTANISINSAGLSGKRVSRYIHPPAIIAQITNINGMYRFSNSRTAKGFGNLFTMPSAYRADAASTLGSTVWRHGVRFHFRNPPDFKEGDH